MGRSPNPSHFGKPVTLGGTVIREFDMSFVDSDLSPIRNPAEVAQAVAEAKSKHAADPARVGKPVPHLILQLERPITVTSADPVHTKAHEIREIDLLGGGANGVTEKELGKARFVVSGTLWEAETVHHLRPVIMIVTGIERAK